jgi:hypothetical protein
VSHHSLIRILNLLIQVIEQITQGLLIGIGSLRRSRNQTCQTETHKQSDDPNLFLHTVTSLNTHD